MGEPILPEMAGLWIARAVLLVALILHVVVVSQLALQSAEARPVNYVKSKKAAASLPALWMMFSGIADAGIHCFSHFAFHAPERSHWANLNTVTFTTIWRTRLPYGPSRLATSSVMVVLGFHLFHGVWSLFQTSGIDNPDRNRGLRAFALVATVALVVGFSAVPVSFLLGDLVNMPAPVDYLHSLLTSH